MFQREKGSTMNDKAPLRIQTDITLLKPIDQVFAAVLSPQPFFIGRSSGPLEAGKTITWQFEDFPGEFPISVQQIVPSQLIRYQWGGAPGEMNTVQFDFKKFESTGTTVQVMEEGWPSTEVGRAHSYRNTAGWMNMLCCLKACLEYGINLRKGAFLHMKGKV